MFFFFFFLHKNNNNDFNYTIMKTIICCSQNYSWTSFCGLTWGIWFFSFIDSRSKLRLRKVEKYKEYRNCMILLLNCYIIDACRRLDKGFCFRGLRIKDEQSDRPGARGRIKGQPGGVSRRQRVILPLQNKK